MSRSDSEANCWPPPTERCNSTKPACRPRFYIPRDDVQMDLLRPTSFHTTCPFKGEASYWSADIGGQTHDGIVWAYEAPIPAAAEIAGYLSFYPNRTEVTVDGETLAA